jgi:hypothetical protein
MQICPVCGGRLDTVSGDKKVCDTCSFQIVEGNYYYENSRFSRLEIITLREYLDAGIPEPLALNYIKETR